MTDKEIIEGNKLIAEFMGWKCTSRKSYNDDILVLYTDKDTIFKYNKHGYLYNKNPWDAPLKYHSSWDWLMPVVEKIKSLGDSYEINGLYGKVHYRWCHKYDEESNNEIQPIRINGKINELQLLVMYKAIIKFIKWYNDNK
jgi:hypothetical protein